MNITTEELRTLREVVRNVEVHERIHHHAVTDLAPARVALADIAARAQHESAPAPHVKLPRLSAAELRLYLALEAHGRLDGHLAWRCCPCLLAALLRVVRTPPAAQRTRVRRSPKEGRRVQGR